MASVFPRFQLFANDGTTLIYEFENVLDWNPDPFQDPNTFVEHTSLRGQGGIIIEGTTASWNFELEFFLSADGYEPLIALMSAVPTTILFNTQYILKIELTSGGSTKDLKVKRLIPINLGEITGNRKVTQSQKGTITFRVDVWV